MIMAGIVSSAITFQSVTMSALAKGAVPANASRTIATVAVRVMQAGSEGPTDITIFCGAFRGAGQSGRAFRSTRIGGEDAPLSAPIDGNRNGCLLALKQVEPHGGLLICHVTALLGRTLSDSSARACDAFR